MRWRVAAVCFPFLLLLVLEVALRTFGYGVPMSFTVRGDVDGRAMILGNPYFSRKYFDPQLARDPIPFSVPAVKSAGTCRIFVLGESAAQGFPEPAFGVARLLEALLRDQYPATRFEVINTAITAINSHAIIDIARECAGLEADVFVVYAGNNEVVGPYGAGTVFDSLGPHFLIRTKIAARSTRTGQLLLSAARGLTFGDALNPQAWLGMELFTRQQVRAADPRLEATNRNFEENLQALCRAAERSGIPVVLGTVGVNLKDCAPFASVHRAGLAAAALQQWDAVYARGVALEKQGTMPEALKQYEEAAALDGEYADLVFRIARCNWALGEFAKARNRYEQARDQDALRFRADRRINEIIRSVAAQASPGHVWLADIENALREQSPHGIPGREHFYEHVHFRFSGNYLAARVLLEAVRKVLPEPVRIRPSFRPVLSEADCARALAFTALDRRFGATRILDLISVAPFTIQATHAEAVASLQAEQESLQSSSVTANAVSEALVEYENVLRKGDTDWSLRHRYASILMDDAENPSAAEKVYRALVREAPQSHFVQANLGWAIFQQGRVEEGIHHLRAALALNPFNIMAHNNLGFALASQGKTGEALRHYREALRLGPTFAKAHNNLGFALAGQGKTEEALLHYREAVRADPNFAVAHLNWALLLDDRGQTEEALGHYREVLRINPNCALAHNNWGYALACQNKLDDAIGHYRQALQLDPRYAMARVNLRNALLSRATAYAAGGRFPEAAQSAREAAGLSGAGQDKELTERIAKRIAAYETGQSYHEREP